MAEAAWGQGDISFSAVVAILRRYRRWIVLSTLLGATLFGAVAFVKPAMYAASAAFVAQGNDAVPNALAGLAGQLGVNLTGSNQALSPEFYRRLLGSRVLLTAIANDTLVVREMGGKRIPFLDLFEIPAGSWQRRTDLAITRLQQIVAVSIEKSTGIVQLTASTRWPSVSLAIVTSLVDGVNTYNERMRQSQAAAERRFIEGRLNVASADLRSAEDRLSEFQRNNRQFGSASELNFERERLQREISLRQQVFTSLTQAYEDARVREVRDTPVITIFEPPSVPALPQPRHRAQSAILGAILGFIVGSLFAFASILRRRREEEFESEPVTESQPRPAASFLARGKWLRGG